MSGVIEKIHVSDSWDFDNRKDSVFNGDYVIDAYLKGRKDGLKSHQKALLETLNKNVDSCGLYSYEIIAYLNKFHIKYLSAFLRINGWDSFKVIVSVKEDDFLKPEFLEIYDFISALEEKICTDIFKVDFSFLDFNAELSETNLKSDGYILKLRPPNEIRARRA